MEDKMSVVMYDMINDSIDDLEERKKFLQSKCMDCWNMTDELALQSLRFIVMYENDLIECRDRYADMMEGDPYYRGAFMAINNARRLYHARVCGIEQRAIDESMQRRKEDE